MADPCSQHRLRPLHELAGTEQRHWCYLMQEVPLPGRRLHWRWVCGQPPPVACLPVLRLRNGETCTIHILLVGGAKVRVRREVGEQEVYHCSGASLREDGETTIIATTPACSGRHEDRMRRDDEGFCFLS